MEKIEFRKSTAKQKTKYHEIKRTKALFFLTIMLFIVYVSIIWLGFLLSWQISKVWLSLFLAFAGVYLIVRGLFFHLDSNYLLGFILFGFGIFSGINFFQNLNFADVIYFSILSLSFLAVYFIFRQNIYIISFALSCLEVLLLIVNKFSLNILTFILLHAMLVALIFVVFLSVTRINREKKGAVSDK
jgi:hypothetical protein